MSIVIMKIVDILFILFTMLPSRFFLFD